MTASSRLRTIDPWLVGVVLAAGFAYGETLLRHVGYTGDTAKFQMLAHVAGTPHEPGSPLYLLILRVFDFIVPVGSHAVRADLLSLVLGLAAIVVVDRILRSLGAPAPAAAAGAALFAASPTFWSQAVVAEVYTLHMLFLTTIIWTFIRWSQDRSVRWFMAGCAVTALSFANHLTTLLVVPALFVLVVRLDRGVFVDPARLAWVAGLILLGASPYLVLFIRTANPGSPYVEMAPTDLSSFWYYVSGGQFADRWYSGGLSWVIYQRIPIAAEMIWREFGGFLVPMAAGLALIRPTSARSFLLLVLAGCLVLTVGYTIPDIFIYFLPVYVICAVGYGTASAWALERVPARWRTLAAMVVICGPLAWGGATWPWVDQSRSVMMERHTLDALNAVANDAVLISPDYDYAGVLWYYTIGEGWEKRNVQALHLHDRRGFESAPHEYAEAVAAYLNHRVPLRLPVERRAVSPGCSVYLFLPFARPAPPVESRLLSRLNPELNLTANIPARRAEWRRVMSWSGLKLEPVNEDLQRIVPAE